MIKKNTLGLGFNPWLALSSVEAPGLWVIVPSWVCLARAILGSFAHWPGVVLPSSAMSLESACENGCPPAKPVCHPPCCGLSSVQHTSALASETFCRASLSVLRGWDHKEIVIHFIVENRFPLKLLVCVQSIRILCDFPKHLQSWSKTVKGRSLWCQWTAITK